MASMSARIAFKALAEVCSMSICCGIVRAHSLVCYVSNRG